MISRQELKLRKITTLLFESPLLNVNTYTYEVIRNNLLSYENHVTPLTEKIEYTIAIGIEVES